MSWEPRDTWVAHCGQAFPNELAGRHHEAGCTICKIESGEAAMVASLNNEDEVESFLAVIQKRYQGREFVVHNETEIYLMDGDKIDAKSVWEFSMGWCEALAFAEERYGDVLPEPQKPHPATTA